MRSHQRTVHGEVVVTGKGTGIAVTGEKETGGRLASDDREAENPGHESRLSGGAGCSWRMELWMLYSLFF